MGFICLPNSSQCENTLSTIKSRMFVVRSSMRYIFSVPNFSNPQSVLHLHLRNNLFSYRCILIYWFGCQHFSVAILAAHKIKKNITIRCIVKWIFDRNVMLYVCMFLRITNKPKPQFRSFNSFSFCNVYIVYVSEYVLCRYMVPQTFLHKSTLVLFNIHSGKGKV